MSKVKSPQEKKQLSYRRDCRNTTGEKGSCVPRRKQCSHQAQRRVTRHALSPFEGTIDEDCFDRLEIRALDRARAKQLGSFRKWKHTPLREGIETKRARRMASQDRAARDRVIRELDARAVARRERLLNRLLRDGPRWMIRNDAQALQSWLRRREHERRSGRERDPVWPLLFSVDDDQRARTPVR
jgi:hypothetical protein